MAEEYNHYFEVLLLGTDGEKLEALKELADIAKDCRVKADAALLADLGPAERERHKAWREFRRQIGFKVFGLVLDMARLPAGSETRDLAADLLAHLWHPAAVDRLVEDILTNAKKLTHTQVSGIFANLAGIGNEPAALALIRLWSAGYAYEAVAPLAACDSRTANEFLFRQARDNKDEVLRGYCLLYLKLERSAEAIEFLREKLISGTVLERSGAVRKICAMRITSMVPDLVTVYKNIEDSDLKREISVVLKCLDKKRDKGA